MLLGAGWLAVLRAIGASKLGVFFIGKALSLLAGTATVAVTFVVMRTSFRVRPAGAMAGLAFLALAGPLAMWSCSSLEMSMVALLVILLVAAMLRESRRADRVAALAATLLLLIRIDGFVPVGAILFAFTVFADNVRRRTIVRSIMLPTAVVFVVYHGWRVWYFGEYLTTPIYAKVLYKLSGRRGLVINEPVPYGLSFLRTYGLPLALTAIAAIFVTAVRNPRGRPLLVAAAVMGLYAAGVGDWMAGFRFFVPELAVIALLLGLAVSSLAHDGVRRAVAASMVVWFSWTAYGYATRYDSLEYRESWWHHASFDIERFFGPYYGFYRELRDRVPPGSRTAFNQAGFIPFMLNLDNMDDLGVCSKFVAKLPTTDIVFAEPGRYSPLTNLPTLRTAHAYLLYREPRYVLARADNLRHANFDQIPREILAGRYQLTLVDSAGENVLYERTAIAAAPFQHDPKEFLENLAHTSRIRHAWLDGAAVPAAEWTSRLAFLAGQSTTVAFPQRRQITVQFGHPRQLMDRLDLNDIWSRAPVLVELKLEDETHHVLYRERFRIEGQARRDVHVPFAPPIAATRLVIDLVNLADQEARVRLFDMRVQGQTSELAAHVRTLAFPPPEVAR